MARRGCPLFDAAGEIGMRSVHAGIEQAHGDAFASRPVGAPCGEGPGLSAVRPPQTAAAWSA